MTTAVDAAKRVLEADEQVPYGIFGHVGGSGYFPSREFLNEFLIVGCDPCDQDGRLARWMPFVLRSEEYDVIQRWWVAKHNGAVVSDLGAACWDEWVQRILNPEDWGYPDGLPRLGGQEPFSFGIDTEGGAGEIWQWDTGSPRFD